MNSKKTLCKGILLIIGFCLCRCKTDDNLPLNPELIDAFYGHKYEVAKKTSEDLLAHKKLSYEPTQSQVCRKVLGSMNGALRKLRKNLPKHKVRKTSLPYRLSRLTANRCRGQRQHHAFSAVEEAMNKHFQRIGVILPLSGKHSHLGIAVKKGMLARCQQQGNTCQDSLFFVDNFGTAQGTVQALAELVFVHEISVLIGGIEKKNAQVLAQYSHKLLLPYLVLNKNKSITQNKPYAYQIYPQDAELANALAAVAKTRQIRSVTILKPTHGRSDEICLDLEKKLKQKGIHSKIIPYVSGQFDSMNSAVTQITHTDKAERMEEYEKLYNKARVQASDKKLPFVASSVILEPQLTSDAVFIPDNFRIVRHFINLFKYHGVKNLPLIGNNEWRSAGLIYPWEKFLHGSFFADFVGSYQHIPRGIDKTLDRSEYFVHPSQVIQVDFQLLGYHAFKIAKIALSRAGKNKRQIIKNIRSIKRFAHKQRSQGATWGAYVLGIQNRSIKVLTEP